MNNNTLSILANTPSYRGSFTGNGAGLTDLNASQITSGIFFGNGSGLTNLNASQFTSGTVPWAQLPSTLVTNNATGLALAGTFSGNGGGLTNVPGALAWQTVPGSSQSASPNAAYLLTNNALVIVTLPASPNVGDIVRVSGGGGGGWKIAKNSGQMILRKPDLHINRFGL